MALVLLAGIVAMAIAGTACRKSDGAAVPQRAPPCETAGRMNLVALAGIPALGRVISEWLQSGSNELAGAFRNGQIPPLEGMRVARLCQTSRRAPSGSREMAVTLSGNEVPALYARLAAAAPPGKPLRIETWGTAEILTGERTWVALHDGRLVIATTDELLRRLVSGPVDGEIGDDDALLSLSFTGQALADILSGGQPFRAATLNAVRALHVDVGSDGTRLSARLSTSDAPAAAELLAALQKFLDGFKEAMKRGGPQRPIDVSVRGVGADVVVSAVFGKEALDSFVQNLAARVARGHVRPRVAAGPH
jgi:hypothetical protein